MSKAKKYSTLGGLVGVLLSEVVVNVYHSINGGQINQQARAAFDLIGYAAFAGIASLPSLIKYQINMKKEEKAELSLSDYVTIAGNTIVTGALGVYGLYLCDGQPCYYH